MIHSPSSVVETPLDALSLFEGLKLFSMKKIGDERGYFAELYHVGRYQAMGLPEALSFYQDNTSLSQQVGVLRGLHFQTKPFAQAKLITCLQGAILDVVVDIRTQSPTYGQHVALVLSAENARQLWVPEGFAHGFCTLEPNTLITYKVTAPYAPECDKGLAWNDPALGIQWPFAPHQCQLSPKDTTHPNLEALPAYF
ncbi:MAG: dTDP-4-dehydrorhamnose 3,5-epimerase [Vampirovibrionales bacterium]